MTCNLIFVVLAVVAGHSSPSFASSDKLVVTGSSTVAPLISEIGKRFEKQRPGARVDVQSGGSSRGLADTRQGLADIGMISRQLRPDESDLLGYTIARDGVSIITHSKNEVKALTDDQIKKIFTGAIKNWKEVGGRDATIVVVSKAEGRSTLELFLQYFKLRSSELKPHIIIGDNVQGIKTVAGNANSIGYVSIGAAEAEIKAGASLRLLPIGGVAANIVNVRNGKFPLSRPLVLVTAKKPVDVQKEFLDFASSSSVKDLIEGQYFVPVSQ